MLRAVKGPGRDARPASGLVVAGWSALSVAALDHQTRGGGGSPCSRSATWAGFNVLIHALGSVGVWILLLVPSLERWVDGHVVAGS
jgi:hypothetical protein